MQGGSSPGVQEGVLPTTSASCSATPSSGKSRRCTYKQDHCIEEPRSGEDHGTEHTERKDHGTHCTTIESFYQPPFLFAHGTGGSRSRNHRRRPRDQWVTGLRTKWRSHTGRRGHSPVPVCARNPRNRFLATIQRTGRSPGQRSPRRERECTLHRCPCSTG